MAARFRRRDQEWKLEQLEMAANRRKLVYVRRHEMAGHPGPRSCGSPPRAESASVDAPDLRLDGDLPSRVPLLDLVLLVTPTLAQRMARLTEGSAGKPTS